MIRKWIKCSFFKKGDHFSFKGKTAKYASEIFPNKILIHLIILMTALLFKKKWLFVRTFT